MATKASGRSSGNSKFEKGVQITARSVNLGAANERAPEARVQPTSNGRVRDLRNDLGYACSELEETLVKLGVVDSQSYGSARNSPKEPEQDPSMLDVLRDLQSEAQSVYGRFVDFVSGEDRGEEDTDEDVDADEDSKPSRVAAETTAFGKTFKAVVDGTCVSLSSISHCIDRLEDSLLSRPSNGEVGAEGSAKLVRPESVIEMLEHVELTTSNLCSKIHGLNESLRTTF